MGIGTAVISLFALAWMDPSQPSAGPPVEAMPPAADIITLEIVDTTVSPADSMYTLAVYLTNPESEVAGFELDFLAHRADLVVLPESVAVETLVTCPLPPACDTTIDTVTVAPIDLTGSVIADWELVSARALTPTYFRMGALADWPGGGLTPPLPPSDEPQLLFHMIVARVADSALFDTLQDREVTWLINPLGTVFTDSAGQEIGDAANVLVDGTLSFESLCTVGDTDGSGFFTAADIIYLVRYVFKSGPLPVCGGVTGDANCSGVINSADIIYLVLYAFKDGPPPCP
jgi:hypothetical protein